MPTGIQVQAKIKSTLDRLNATSRVVSLRNVSHTSGNALLGLGQTQTVTDTVLTPQPAVETVNAEQIAVVGGDRIQLGDYLFTLDGTIAESTFKTQMLVYGTEVLKIVHYEPFALDGLVMAWQVYARGVRS